MKRRKERQDGSPRHGKGYGKTAKVGVAWGVFRDTVKQLIFVPGAMLLARLLSPEEFGISAAAVLVITLANRLGTLGLNAALVRLKTLTPDHLSTVFTYNLGMGAVAFSVLQFAAPAIAAFYRQPEVGDAIRVAALSFLFVPFGAINSAIFQREMRFKETAFNEWAFAVVFPVVSVALALSDFGFWSIVYGQLAARASQVAMKVYQGRWWPRLYFSRAAFRELAPFGAGVAANRLLGFASGKPGQHHRRPPVRDRRTGLLRQSVQHDEQSDPEIRRRSWRDVSHLCDHFRGPGAFSPRLP